MADLKPCVKVWNEDDVTCASHTGVAHACGQGAPPDIASRIDLVIRELAWNLVHHAGGGVISFSNLKKESHHGIMVESSDAGGGIATLSRERNAPLAHGKSISLGIGLAAVQRNSAEFTMQSAPSRGTCIRAVVWWASKSS